MSDYSDFVLSLNPVAYWRLGEASIGEPAVDEMGSYNGTYGDAIAVGYPGLVSGDPDTSAWMNSSGRITFDPIPLPDARSFIFYINKPTLTSYASLIGENGDRDLRIRYNYSLFYGMGAQMSLSPTMDTNKTYQVIMTTSAGDPAANKTYINGVLLNTVSGVAKVPFNPIYMCITNNNNDNQYRGYLDDPAVFDYELSQEEITKLYKFSTGELPHANVSVSVPDVQVTPATAPILNTSYRQLVMDLAPVVYYRLGEVNFADPAIDEMGGTSGVYGGDCTPGQFGLITNDPDTSTLFTAGRVDIPQLNFAGGYSIVASIKLNVVGVGQQTIVASDDGSYGFAVYNSTLYFLNSGVQCVTELLPGVVYHVAFTVGAGNVIENAYINGALDCTSGYTVVGPYIINDIGAMSSNLWSPFQGTIDDVSIYDRELTAKNISDLYKASIDTYIPPIISDYTVLVKSLAPEAYWKLGELNTSESAEDEMGNYDGAYADGINVGYTGLIANDLDTCAQVISTGRVNFPAINLAGARSFVFSINGGLDMAGYRTLISEDDGKSILIKGQWVSFDGMGSTIELSPILSLDTTYQVVLTTSSGDPATNSVYIDGVLQGTEQTAAVPFTPVALGVRSSIGATQFTGYMDEVSVYNYELLQADITSLYDESIKEGTKPTNYNELVMAYRPLAYWRLEEFNDGEPAKDETGIYNGSYASGSDLTFQEDSLIVDDTEGKCVWFNENESYTGIVNIPTISMDLNTHPVSFVWLFNEATQRWSSMLGEAWNVREIAIDDGEIKLHNMGDYVPNQSTLILSTGVTYHIAVTKQAGFHPWKLYIDSEYIGDTQDSYNGTFSPYRLAGSGPDADDMVYGHLDEPALFRDELTPIQIQELYSVAQGAAPGEGKAQGKINIVKVFSPMYKESTRYAEYVTRLYPVAYWRMGETNFSDVAIDEMGNHDGYYHGNVTPGQPSLLVGDSDTSCHFFEGAPDDTGGSLRFDPITIPDGPSTYMFLMNGEDTDLYRSVIGEFYDTRSLYVRSRRINMKGMGGDVAMSPTFDENRLYHVAISKGPGTVKHSVYVDGLFAGTSADTYGGYFAPKQIGSDSPENWEQFEGHLDEVAIFDKQLTAEEINKAYNLSMGIVPNGDASCDTPDIQVYNATASASSEVVISGAFTTEISVSNISAEAYDNTGVVTIPDAQVSFVSGFSTSTVDPIFSVADISVSTLDIQATSDISITGEVANVVLDTVGVIASGTSLVSVEFINAEVSNIRAAAIGDANPYGSDINDVLVTPSIVVASITDGEVFRDEMIMHVTVSKNISLAM
ncbi:MAG: hypothetical protein DRQ40_03555 [Gammaproteobacteria bacterium]|nr:MAG: hypothetical protein DRQ40_03555 [Gammaproteobacteria bacterium]